MQPASAVLTVAECGDAAVRAVATSGDADLDWRAVHGLTAWLDARGAGTGISGLIPTYDSVLIEFDPLVTSTRELLTLVDLGAAHLNLDAAGAEAVRHFDVPVYYGGEDGPDLGFVAELMGWPAERLVEVHSSPTYVIRCYGSPAASPMMDAPPLPLPVPRLGSPRASVPAGVVSLAGRQAVIAPASAPGGWRVIGRTPLRLLDLASPTLVPYRPGDTVRFHPIEAAEYRARVGEPMEAAR